MKNLLIILTLALAPVIGFAEGGTTGMIYKDSFYQRDISISHSTVTFSSSSVLTMNISGYQEIVVNPTVASYFYTIDGSTENLTTIGIKESTNTVKRNVIKAYGSNVNIQLISGASDETVAIMTLTP